MRLAGQHRVLIGAETFKATRDEVVGGLRGLFRRGRIGEPVQIPEMVGEFVGDKLQHLPRHPIGLETRHLRLE